jgi:hypothetical protein
MDLSKLSTEDLLALQSGDLSKVSTAGLRTLQQAAPQPKRQLAPEDTPDAGEALLIGAGRTFDRLGKGMQQLYYGAKQHFDSPDATSLVTGRNASQRELDRLRASAAEDDRMYAPLQEARPWATGIGESLPSMVIPGGGAATLGGNVVRMAAAGALPGLLEYGSAEERAKRGAIGAVTGAAVPVLAAGARTAWSLAEPHFAAGRDAIIGRTLNRAAGDAAPAVRARLAGAQELVPGSAPTAAQVAESGGIAALERMASSANPDAFAQRGMEQASARLNALRGIAGQPGQLDAALARRKAIGDAAYGRARAAGVDGGMADALKPQIATLLERDEIKAAINEAKSLAKSEGYNLGDNLGSVQGLQYVKQALDDRIAELPPKAANKIRVWSQTSADLKSVLEDIVPDLRQADRVFARMSREPNRMQVGQALLDAAQPALADFGGLGAENGARYAMAMRNADATAARALGRPRATMADVLSPQQTNTALAVAQDLARRSNAQNLGRGVGSNTFQNLAMQNIAEQSGLPRLTGGLLNLPGINRAAAWSYRTTNQQMQDQLAEALLNPQRAAELMQRADQRWLQENPVIRRTLEQVALRGAAAGPMGAAPMLLPQQ